MLTVGGGSEGILILRLSLVTCCNPCLGYSHDLLKFHALPHTILDFHRDILSAQTTSLPLAIRLIPSILILRQLHDYLP